MGEHQNSPISPALFDIYTEHFCEKLKSRFHFPLEYRSYADDFCFITSHDKLE